MLSLRPDKPSVMFGDLRIDQFGPDCFEPWESSAVVTLQGASSLQPGYLSQQSTEVLLIRELIFESGSSPIRA
jgi:hypothetical protein